MTRRAMAVILLLAAGEAAARAPRAAAAVPAPVVAGTSGFATGDGARIEAGAIELGLAAAVDVIERNAAATLGARSGRFFGRGSNLVAVEADMSYRHVSSLDIVELGASFDIQRAAATGVIPYLGVGMGVRQEWIGSFREARVPVGFDVGVRALMGSSGRGTRAVVRTEYRFRRVLRDPVADFNEHELRVGVSLLIAPRRPSTIERVR